MYSRNASGEKLWVIFLCHKLMYYLDDHIRLPPRSLHLLRFCVNINIFTHLHPILTQILINTKYDSYSRLLLRQIILNILYYMGDSKYYFYQNYLLISNRLRVNLHYKTCSKIWSYDFPRILLDFKAFYWLQKRKWVLN